jgi:hypothetical protein
MDSNVTDSQDYKKDTTQTLEVRKGVSTTGKIRR